MDLWPDKLDLPKGFQDDKGNYFPGIMRSYQIGSSLLFHEVNCARRVLSYCPLLTYADDTYRDAGIVAKYVMGDLCSIGPAVW